MHNTTTGRAGTGPATALRRRVLHADATFLIVIGGVQAGLEVGGYVRGVGPLGAAFHGSPYAIGFVEAHGLAVLVGLVLLAAARHSHPGGHALGLAVHLLLGAANLVFWPSYAAFGIVPAGVASTVAHVAFVLAHTAALIALRRARPARTP